MLAVEVLVEAVVVANAILQEQRRRARLAGMDLRALVTKAPPVLLLSRVYTTCYGRDSLFWFGPERRLLHEGHVRAGC